MKQKSNCYNMLLAVSGVVLVTSCGSLLERGDSTGSTTTTRETPKQEEERIMRGIIADMKNYKSHRKVGTMLAYIGSNKRPPLAREARRQISNRWSELKESVIQHYEYTKSENLRGVRDLAKLALFKQIHKGATEMLKKNQPDYLPNGGSSLEDLLGL